jgi:hypothetical protein
VAAFVGPGRNVAGGGESLSIGHLADALAFLAFFFGGSVTAPPAASQSGGVGPPQPV